MSPRIHHPFWQADNIVNRLGVVTPIGTGSFGEPFDIMVESSGTPAPIGVLAATRFTAKDRASLQPMLPPSMISRIMVIHGFRSQRKKQL